jgi:hypothetical protein
MVTISCGFQPDADAISCPGHLVLTQREDVRHHPLRSGTDGPPSRVQAAAAVAMSWQNVFGPPQGSQLSLR